MLSQIEQSVSNKISASEMSLCLGVNVNNKLFGMMSDNIYSNVPNAIVRELVSNAIDASVVSNTKEPVIVHIPQNINQDFYVQDFGCGMSIETMIHVFANYFSSTKENDETQIGGFGLGAKTPFAYIEESDFRVETTSPDDGVRRTFVFKSIRDEMGDKYPHYQHLDDLDIKNSNIKGTKISFALKKEADINDFLLACIPIMYAVHPIEFTGLNVFNYLDEKNDKETHHAILTELSDNGFVLLNENDKDKVHCHFDLENLYIESGKLRSSSSNHSLKTTLNLRLGSVIYQVKMNNNNQKWKTADEIWGQIRKNLSEMQMYLMMIDVQQNGHIALDVSRENIRDIPLNKKNLNDLLMKTLFAITQKLIEYIEKQFVYLEDCLKNKKMTGFSKTINSLNNSLTNLIYSKRMLSNYENDVFVDKSHRDFFQLCDDKIIEYNEKLNELEMTWVKQLNQVFVVNFDNHVFADGWELYRNPKGKFYYVEKSYWDMVCQDNDLKEKILKNIKSIKYITLSDDENHEEWEGVENYFEKSLIENRIKEISESKKENILRLDFILNENISNNFLKNKLCDSKRKSAILLLPKEYWVRDYENLSNMDKVMLLCHNFIVQLFDFDYDHQINKKHEIKEIKKLNKSILSLFNKHDLDVLRNDDEASKICFVRTIDWHIQEFDANDVLEYFYHFVVDSFNFIQNKNKHDGNLFHLSKLNKNLCEIQFQRQITTDLAKKFFLEKINVLSSKRMAESGSELNFACIKEVVFEKYSPNETQNMIFNYFNKKYHLIEKSKPYCENVNKNDKEQFKMQLESNIKLYEETGLFDYFKNKNKNDNIVFHYENKEDLKLKMNRFFNILSALNQMKGIFKKSKKSVVLDLKMNANFNYIEMDFINQNKDINELEPFIKNAFEQEIKEIEESHLPDNKMLALYLKILKEHHDENLLLNPSI